MRHNAYHMIFLLKGELSGGGAWWLKVAHQHHEGRGHPTVFVGNPNPDASSFFSEFNDSQKKNEPQRYVGGPG